MHVTPSRHSNSWSSGITMRIGGWALHLGAVNVPFVSVTFIHVAAVVCIVALTASLPFRILIPTSNIGRTNLLLHWCCIVGFKDCIQEFQVLSLYECLCLHMFNGVRSTMYSNIATWFKLFLAIEAMYSNNLSSHVGASRISSGIRRCLCERVCMLGRNRCDFQRHPQCYGIYLTSWNEVCEWHHEYRY